MPSINQQYMYVVVNSEKYRRGFTETEAKACVSILLFHNEDEKMLSLQKLLLLTSWLARTVNKRQKFDQCYCIYWQPLALSKYILLEICIRDQGNKKRMKERTRDRRKKIIGLEPLLFSPLLNWTCCSLLLLLQFGPQLNDKSCCLVMQPAGGIKIAFAKIFEACM